jgi:hypothetical protein
MIETDMLVDDGDVHALPGDSSFMKGSNAETGLRPSFMT